MEIKSALEILVEEGVIGEATEDKNFNLILTRDCYVSRVKAINRAMKKYAAQFIDEAANSVSIDLQFDSGHNYEVILKETILEIKNKIK